MEPPPDFTVKQGRNQTSHHTSCPRSGNFRERTSIVCLGTCALRRRRIRTRSNHQTREIWRFEKACSVANPNRDCGEGVFRSRSASSRKADSDQRTWLGAFHMTCLWTPPIHSQFFDRNLEELHEWRHG